MIPIAYEDSVAERISAESGGKLDAFIDLAGGGYVDMARQLGIALDRINTIIDFAAAGKYGVKTDSRLNERSGSI